MKKHIIHMDLKPANILIADNMVAKITDFGLSRMLENSQAKTTNRFSSLGYTAPEYLENGKMSVKSDVYSLGIIIVELVTGQRSIPDSNNVLRRWRHRWHKSQKETPFRYQHIAKLIEIGLLCQERDPYKRPFISDIIRVINELESTDRQISNANESMVGQISLYSEDAMLGIEPLELCFPFESNNHMSCSLELTNETNAFFAFNVKTTSPLPYCIQPNKDIVAPQSKYSVNITLQLDHAPQDGQYSGDFIVRSTKVNASLITEDITEDIFNREEGKLVDEVNLTVTYTSEVTQVDASHGSPIIADTRNLDSPQESSVLPAETESKISASTSDEVIQFDPPELSFPLVPDKDVFSSIKIINTTKSYVSFMLSFPEKNIANYSYDVSVSVLPPESTQWLTIIREENEDVENNMQVNDEVFVWYAIVPEDIGVSDIDWEDYDDCKNLHIILTEVNTCTSNDLIQFDPPELSFPCLNKTSISSVNIVNVTDCYIGFNTWTFNEENVRFYAEPCQGILPPRSTQKILVKMKLKGKELEDMQCENSLFVWNMIVAEGVEAENLNDYISYEDSKKVPLINKKTSPCTSSELIQFDPPELSLPFSPNKALVFTVNIVNSTDYFVAFHLYEPEENVGWYYIDPDGGVMPPRSTERLVVQWTPRRSTERLVVQWSPDEKEEEDMECQDKFYIWNSLVSEGIEASDIIEDQIFFLRAEDQIDDEDIKELPIIYKKTSLCSSDELILFEPPQLPFPFFPNKRVSKLCFFNIVNLTDHSVGFSIRFHEDNSAQYTTEPDAGILPPQSTQKIKVRRTVMEKEPEDMQCKDKILVWNGIVTEGIQPDDVCTYGMEGHKELPIVLTKLGESSSL